MLVKFSPRFITLLSPKIVLHFQQELFNELKKLDFMPYKFRKSIHFDDENIRDFVFKGYIVPYFVDTHNDTLLILAICKENLL